MSNWIQDIRQHADSRNKGSQMSEESRVNDERKLAIMFDDIVGKLLDRVEGDAGNLRAALRLRSDEMGAVRLWSGLVILKHTPKSVQLKIGIERPLLSYAYTFTPGLTA